MKLPRIRNPLFAALLAIVSFAAFAEPGGATHGKENTTSWTQSDSHLNGLLTNDSFVSYPAFDQEVDEIDADSGNRISKNESVDGKQSGSRHN